VVRRHEVLAHQHFIHELVGDVSNYPGRKPNYQDSNMLAIAECPCPGDFISAGIRSTFSKRSISGTALTTDTSRPGALTEVYASFGSMNLRPNGS
jgi:hypothetical protein